MSDAYGDLSDRGIMLVFPFRDGSCRLVLYDYARADAPVTEPVTLAEVKAGLARITGRDFGARDIYCMAASASPGSIRAVLDELAAGVAVGGVQCAAQPRDGAQPRQ